MSYHWPEQDITLEHFSPDEFKRPELMDRGYLYELDRLRMRCGFPITINDDARTREDLERIYAREIAEGVSYPTDSAHLYDDELDDPILVRATDLEPSIPREGDGSDRSLQDRELELLFQILRLWKEGIWKHLGLGIETGHTHTDDTPRLGARRPVRWVAVSR